MAERLRRPLYERFGELRVSSTGGLACGFWVQKQALITEAGAYGPGGRALYSQDQDPTVRATWCGRAIALTASFLGTSQA